MSNIGSISYVNQNQLLAIDNQAKLHAKVLADEGILPEPPEVKIIEESSESSKTNTEFDKEKTFDDNSKKQGKKEKEKEKSEFFGVEIENEEKDDTVSNTSFDIKV